MVNVAHHVQMGVYNVLQLETTEQSSAHHHHHQSLNRVGRWGTTDNFATIFAIIPCSPLPSGTCGNAGLSIP